MSSIYKNLVLSFTAVKDTVCAGLKYISFEGARKRVTAGEMYGLLTCAGNKMMHPFILADARDFERAARDYYGGECDEVIKRSLDYVFSYCDELLDTHLSPVLEYVLEEDDGLLEISRTVLQRVCALSGAYRISGEEKYAHRAVQELEQVCSFPDWHTAHFLDCAEMAFAVSLGCDWLWEYLSPSQKELFGRTVWKNAIEPALSPNMLKNWWAWSKTNWNNVCYSAIGTACMLFYAYAPERAAVLLARAVNYIPMHFTSFSPDGVYAEGSGYWEYGTAYLCYFIKNIRAFFGTDFGLSKCPGFDKTGYFPLYITLPTGVFNYGDNKEIACASPILYFFAREYKASSLAQFENRYTPEDFEDRARDSMLTALWYSPKLLDFEKEQELPLAVCLSSDVSQETVFMRSSYTDPNAVCAAIKAGYNGINHGDLDIGTFVLDCAGVRWACELGPGNYAAPGYFMNLPGGGRWKNYCKRTEGQNTLCIIPAGKKNGDGQYALGACRFSSFTAYSSGAGRAVLDMTAAYRFSHVKKAVRVFELSEDFSSLVINDCVECECVCDIHWFMHTRASIIVSESGRSAVLTSDGKSLEVGLTEDSDGLFSAREAVRADGKAYKYDRLFPDVRKLCITAKNSLSANFTVVFNLKELN